MMKSNDKTKQIGYSMEERIPILSKESKISNGKPISEAYKANLNREEKSKLIRRSRKRHTIADGDEGDNSDNSLTPSWNEILEKIKPYLKPLDWKHGLYAFLAILCVIINKVLNVLPPLAIKWALDLISSEVVQKHATQPEGSFIEKGTVRAILIAIACFLGSKMLAMIVKLMQDLLQRAVSLDSERRFAIKCYTHLQCLSLSYHLNHSVGETTRIMSRGTDAVYTLIDSLIFSLFPTLFEVIVVSAVFWKLGTPLVAGSTLVAVTIYFTFTIFVRKTRVKFRRRLNGAYDCIAQKETETLVNFETVKMFGRTEEEISQYENLRNSYKDRRVELLAIVSLLDFGQKCIRLSGVCAGLMIAGYKTVYGNPPISPGSFMAIKLYIDQLFQPLSALGYTYRVLTQGLTDLEKTVTMLNSVPEVQDLPDAIEWKPTALESKFHSSFDRENSITFENVSFKYKISTSHSTPLGSSLEETKDPTKKDEENNEVIKESNGNVSSISGIQNISFSIPPGKSAALVGASGSGKTTIVRLILRMYDVDHGSVSVGKHDVRSLTQKSLRSNIGVVTQETILFNASLKYNITYGNENATEEEIWDAVRISSLEEFVSSLPEGLDTLVGERGMKLSGGERQRVGLARCLIKNPGIILLDEATSALDSGTEKVIQENIAKLCSGPSLTTLMIAHRLSTARFADEIIVLNRGMICERGSHDNLIKFNGRYAKMWNDQMSSAKL